MPRIKLNLSSNQSGRYEFLLCLALLWLAGASLRMTIVSLAPAISLIHTELTLSETEVGIVAAIPALLFVLGSALGSSLVGRLGAFKTLMVGLALNALGSTLRAGAFDVYSLYATSALLGLGVALMQPALPCLVRLWVPHKVIFATAIYTNGLLLGGEIAPVALTLPVLVPILGSWRLAFVFWGATSALIAAIIYFYAPKKEEPLIISSKFTLQIEWRRPLLWRLGVMMGCANATYFATSFFIPRYLSYENIEHLLSPALLALNLGQLPASLLLLLFGSRIADKRMTYWLCGLGMLVGLSGIVFLPEIWIVLSTGLVGFASAMILIFVLGLIPVVSSIEEMPKSASLILSVAYGCAVVIPILCGMVMDLSGNPGQAFLPIALCGLTLIVMACVKPIKSD